MPALVLAKWLSVIAVVFTLTSGDVVSAEEVFTNAFLVELTDGHGNEVANEVAKRNGFTNIGPYPVNYLPQTWNKNLEAGPDDFYTTLQQEV